MSGPRAPLRRILQAMGKPGWAWDVGLHGRPHRLGNLEPLLGKASGLNEYLDWIRAGWKGPLILKGILDPEDARAAADIGADGIVVSNHGGRQLDGVLSSTRALPAVVEAVGDRLPVLAASGGRSGPDGIR